MMRAKTPGMKALALGAFALLTLGACGGSDAPSDSSASSGGEGGGGGAQVTLSAIDNEFEPTELTVPGGGEVTVEFTNNGETVHTFTSEELGFDSGNVEPGDSTTVTFTAPDGDTEFVCTLHAESDDMVGTIGVE
jgi:plastocyanin